jgi:hypothetical protein
MACVVRLVGPPAGPWVRLDVFSAVSFDGQDFREPFIATMSEDDLAQRGWERSPLTIDPALGDTWSDDAVEVVDVDGLPFLTWKAT